MIEKEYFSTNYGSLLLAAFIDKVTLCAANLVRTRKHTTDFEIVNDLLFERTGSGDLRATLLAYPQIENAIEHIEKNLGALDGINVFSQKSNLLHYIGEDL